ncbi:MAG: efflux RND transporter permease subunit [Prolixibacteraceae bacterium]|jgi:multidrug efflux pump subunit AcrB|nr:efflux RND transporter permease subunit [Prolixibacteraceae bacterium]
MKKIISEFVRFPFYANLIILAVVIAGGISLVNMKKSFFPETTSRIIQVSVFYPGASPVEMEEGVTSRIEEAIRGIIGIKEISSTSVENSARVTIETTGEYKINEVLQEVKNAVDGISSLPSAAERPIVSKRRSRAMAIMLNLVPSGEIDIDMLTLKQYAQRVEEDFLNSGVMSQVAISGYPAYEISVEVNEDQLLRYNLTFDAISNAITNNNQDVSGGTLKSEEEEMLIRLRSRSSDPDKIANIILTGTSNGGYIRIGDIGIVKKKFSEFSTRKSFLNGKLSVSLMVNKLPEEDMQAITDWVREYSSTFNAQGNGVELVETRAFLDILQSRLDLLLKNGLTGLLLVIISLAFFLSFRLSLWVAWGIPFSFLAMFIVASAYGITINMISLFGMILVIGILVDDGIVIAENIYQHFERGKSPQQAAVDGTMEVLPAVLTSVTTTIIAFIPLMLLQGSMMEMMTHMAFIVVFSLLFSLLEAFFILPAHMGSKHILSRKALEKKNKGLRKYPDKLLVWLRENVYQGMLEWLLKWRYLVISFPIAATLITIGLMQGGFIKTTLFPRVDFNRFEVNVAFTPGDGEAQTEKYLERFEAAIWEVNEELKERIGTDGDVIERVYRSIGSSFSGLESGSHAGSLAVFPKDMEDLPPTDFEVSGFSIANMVRQKIGIVPEARKFTVGGRNRWGSPVSISMLGRNLQELEAAKDVLITELENIPALKDITENIALGKQEVRLKLKPKAYFLGLNEASIARQVRQGFYGGQAQRLQEGRDELRVWVRYPGADRERIGQLENMKIKTPQGDYSLSDLVDYHLERGPVAIQRFNGSREIRVEAETVDPYAPVPDILAKITQDVMPQIEAQFPGVSYVYQGQQKSSNEAMAKIKKYFTIAFLLIIFIMMLHFRSVSQPFIILLMIPLGVFGVMWGHGIHGKALSMMSYFGMVALTGVVINDAIVFLSKYNDLLRQGYKVKKAIVEAGKARLRPIFLTTLTTTFGVYPLILEKSIQAQFLIPMAISLVYGVAFGTMFILVFFPVLIHLLNDFKVFVKYILTGVRYEPEDVEVAIIHMKRKIEGMDIEANKLVGNIDIDFTDHMAHPSK